MARIVTSRVVFVNEPTPELFARAYERMIEMKFSREYPGLKVRVVPKERNEACISAEKSPQV